MKRAASVAALLALGAASPQQSTETARNEEIVLIARKMRMVRLEYGLFGPHLKRCTPIVSSGEARIDRIMCAILDACIRQGHREPKPARQCVNDRIGILEQEAAAPPEWTAPPESAEATAPAKDEIVVRGERPAVAAGLWQFTETGTYIGSRGGVMIPRRRWRMCVKPGEARAVLGRMLGERSEAGGPSACASWRVQVEGDRITGDMGCMLKGLRIRGTLEGRFTESEIAVTKHRRTQGIGFDLESELWLETRGERTRACSQ